MRAIQKCHAKIGCLKNSICYNLHFSNAILYVLLNMLLNKNADVYITQYKHPMANVYTSQYKHPMANTMHTCLTIM